MNDNRFVVTDQALIDSLQNTIARQAVELATLNAAVSQLRTENFKLGAENSALKAEKNGEVEEPAEAQ